MKVKVETTEVGMAMPATTVLRQSRMKSSTVNATSAAPSHMCTRTVSIEALMKRDWSRMTRISMSAGSTARSRSSSACTRSITSTVLVPDCLRTTSCTAFSPFSRESVRGSTMPSSAVPMSRTRSGRSPPRATMRSPKSAARSTRPMVRTTSSRRVLGRGVARLLEHELDDDRRQALLGDAAELVDAVDRVDRLLDHLGDPGLHLLDARALERRGDGDDREVDVRKEVEAEAPVGE